MNDRQTQFSEVDLASIIQSLLQKQFPEFGRLALKYLDAGWDNVSFRLGDDWLIRLPRRKHAVPLLQNEQRWLPELAPHLPFSIPLPRYLGKATSEFPYPWSIVPWIDGETAHRRALSAQGAVDLLQFMVALHQATPHHNAPINPSRGCPLADKSKDFEIYWTSFASSDSQLAPALRSIWDQGLAAPLGDHHGWIHGDLHAHNVLSKEGRIAGVIDWGDLCQIVYARGRASSLFIGWVWHEEASQPKCKVIMY